MLRSAPVVLITFLATASVLAMAASDRIAVSPNPMAGPVSTNLAGPALSGPAFVSGFTDRDEWAAAAFPFVRIDFDDFPGGTPIDSELAQDNIASVTGSSTEAVPSGPVQQFVTSSFDLPFPMFIPGTLPSEPNFLSNDLSPAGGAATGEITLQFIAPVTGVGAFITDGTPLGDFTITLLVGAQELASVDLPPRTLPDSFAGVVSSQQFTGVRFSAADETDSWGLDDLEHNGFSECYLALGGSVGNASFTPMGFTFETQLANVAAWYPVLMDDYPTFTVPSKSTLLDGGLAGGDATAASDLGWPDFVSDDGTFAVQVMMWNPVDVPSAPEQYSQVLLGWIAPDGRVHARPWGDGTIDIALETTQDDQGDTVFGFPFAIPGF